MNYRKGQTALSLDGEWSFAYGFDILPLKTIADIEASGLAILPATVPGNFELDLQANGVIEEPFHGMNIASLTRFEKARIWYFRRFSAEEPEGTEPILTLEGLDCIATVYLNGEPVAECANALVELEIPLAGKLLAENEIVIAIRSATEEAKRYDYPPNLAHLPANYESLYVRKAPHSYGWDIMPRALSAGIWRPATVRFLPKERFDQAYLETQSIAGDGNGASLALHYRVRIDSQSGDYYEIVTEGRCGDSTFRSRRRLLFEAGVDRFGVSQPKLWHPRGRGEANLYDVTVQLLKNGEIIDHLDFSHGIRTVMLDRTSLTDESGSGEFRFIVNGEPVFILGSNWVPADAYHSRDVERIPQMLELMEEIGCNMIRCWGGNVYENDLFFEICDRKGFLVWQDFAMACGVYPQDDDFQHRLDEEARKAIRRLRQHPSLALWSGDNECDQAYFWGGRSHDPNDNVLTRQVLPKAVLEEDGTRPYLPSSPYIDSTAYPKGERYIPEQHLWGPREYYKGPFYLETLAHFASEMGYHGSPSAESIRKFISPEKLWPPQNNEEWLLHSTSPVPGVDLYDYRVELMLNQIRALFGEAPDSLEDFVFASQATQAEAMKFFIEQFRSVKWRRTGIIWWNLIDGWPQLSDAVTDYYFEKKLAFSFIQRSQAPLLVMLKEPKDGSQEVVASNDSASDLPLSYTLIDIDTEEEIASGKAVAEKDAVTTICRIPDSPGQRRFYVLQWESELGTGENHYLYGKPPFDLETYRVWLKEAKWFLE